METELETEAEAETEINRYIESDIFDKKELIKYFGSYVSDIYGFDVEDVREEIKSLLDALIDNIWIYVEYPYVDKVYRNSYYSYFSTKHKPYARDCCRMSFFSEKISHEDFRIAANAKELKKIFLGFSVIRPTLPNLIGRSVISTEAFIENKFQCCKADVEVMVNGVKMKVSGFPYSSQDTETMKCAEATVWSVMEYFGHRYPEYKPVLPSTIVKTLSRLSYERQLPSSGLTAEQISYALKEFNFGVKLYERNTYGAADLKRIFYYYIESGIPFIATLQNRLVAHAVVVIGQELVDYHKTGLIAPRLIAYKRGLVRVFDSADIKRRYVTCDDNHPPYRLASFDNPTQYYSGKPFKNCKITAIIVPLYEKIYLEAAGARKLVLSVIFNYIIKLSNKKNIIFRLLLTSSRSFKNKVAMDASLDGEVKDRILETLMPKFIWLAELIDEKTASPPKAIGMIVIDATEANENKAHAILFGPYQNVFSTFENDEPNEEMVNPSSFEICQNHNRGVIHES